MQRARLTRSTCHLDCSHKRSAIQSSDWNQPIRGGFWDLRDVFRECVLPMTRNDSFSFSSDGNC